MKPAQTTSPSMTVAPSGTDTSVPTLAISPSSTMTTAFSRTCPGLTIRRFARIAIGDSGCAATASSCGGPANAALAQGRAHRRDVATSAPPPARERFGRMGIERMAWSGDDAEASPIGRGEEEKRRCGPVGGSPPKQARESRGAPSGRTFGAVFERGKAMVGSRKPRRQGRAAAYCPRRKDLRAVATGPKSVPNLVRRVRRPH